MKKAIIGLVAVGAVVGFRPVARRVAYGMREHCVQLADQCKQMAAQVGGRGPRGDATSHGSRGETLIDDGGLSSRRRATRRES